MRNLLFKERKLALHTTVYLFSFMAILLLIPAYPYYVSFYYTTLAIFFTFISGRENKDILYTVLLPVRKRDVVKARCCAVAGVQVVQILISVPFAAVSMYINPNVQGNPAGIEPNVAFFGFVFIMYTVFNAIFFPLFYKTGYKAGVPMLVASLAMGVYVIGIELLVNLYGPAKAYLDTSNGGMMLKQIPVLLAGILIYALSMVVIYRVSAKNFEKVDI